MKGNAERTVDLRSLGEWRGTADKERYIVQLFARKHNAASRELYVVQLLVSSSLRFPLLNSYVTSGTMYKLLNLSL